MTRREHDSPRSLATLVSSLVTPESGPATGGGERRAGRWVAVGVLVFLAASAPAVWRYLVAYPREIWQVDLEVYRAGGRALWDGFPLYLVRTPSPQFLPFTYPPFGAIAALPLAAVSLTAAGWCWTALQLGLLWYVVGRSFAPLLRRVGPRAGLVQGLLAAVAVWFLPVQDGLRYGQVNAVIVALCLADLTRRDSARLPRGVLVGLAVAVKLTPGVFWLHWAFSRRWRPLVASVVGFVVATAGSAVVAPGASREFWTSALWDPDRLGPNDGTPNQSVRGVLLRIGPQGTAGSLVWVVLAGLALAGGLLLARRLERQGDAVGVVAVVGLTALLVSPVSWIHHAFWVVVAVGVLVGDGRGRGRVVAAAIGAGLMLLRLPWWGGAWLAQGSAPHLVARAAENCYPVFVVAGLVAIAVVSRTPQEGRAAEGSAPRDAAAEGAEGESTARSLTA
ncbi:MAG: glycosyltransferase 87 family protein [Kineosporiaceae bacterium]